MFYRIKLLAKLHNRVILLTAFTLTLSISKVYGQCSTSCNTNYVTNSSFEVMTTDCDTLDPEMFTDYSQAQDWYGIACKTCPGNGSTPDYYNSSCSGANATENCGFGSGSVGFFTSVDVGGTTGTNSREYVQSQLSTTLTAGTEYCVTLQVKTNPNNSNYVPSDGLGVWFTDDMVDIDVDNGGQQYLGPGSIVNATPQVANPSGNIIDTVCTTVTGTFIATGNEDWIVIGNFRPDNQMQTTASCGGWLSFCFGYLIVDQIEVVEVCTACDATISTAGPFCQNDAAINLTAAQSGGTWSGNGITDINAGTFDPAVAGVGTHSITYGLACGDTDIVSITVNPNDDPSFSYTQSSYCLSDPNPTPTISGLSGGTFTIDNSGTINSSTGEVSLSASGTGSFNITYTTNGPCPQSNSFALTINNSSDATITPPSAFCESDPAANLVAADPGGTWSGTGITDANAGIFDPSVAGAGTHTITYSISGTCGDTDTESITVNPDDDPSFSYSQSSYCMSDPNPTPTITGLSGGSFSINNGGAINTVNGELYIPSSGPGTYTITYTTNGPCPQSATFVVTLTNAADATINPAGSLCESDPAINLTATDAGGNWTGNGITNATNGTFDPSVAGAGTHSIIYTISGSCGDADTINITVNANDDASFSYSQSNYCLSDPNPIPTITGLTGGTFTIDGSGVINASSGEIDLASSGAGTYNVIYTTNGSCPQSDTFNLTISSSFDATIIPVGPYCENDAAVNLTSASNGGTWSGNGITDPNAGTFDPSVSGAGTHNIIYTITGACGDSDTIDIVVNPADNATISYSQSTYCSTDANPVASISGTSGGTFIVDNGGIIDASTGELDLASSVSGNYTVTYITNGSCPDTATTTLTISEASNVQITAQNDLCENDGTVFLQATPSGGTWSGSGIVDSTNGEFNTSSVNAGTYEIVYTIAGNCGDSDTTSITVNSDPVATVSDPVTISYSSSTTLNATGGGSYNWSPTTSLSCSDCQNPVASPESTTTYCVEVNSNGCIDTACTTVTIDYDCNSPLVPTAFTPNSGDVNSSHCVIDGCFIEFHFRVYNRWGELVFESFDQSNCWEGNHSRNDTPLSTGVYVYILEGTNINGEDVSQKGNISLIR